MFIRRLIPLLLILAVLLTACGGTAALPGEDTPAPVVDTALPPSPTTPAADTPAAPPASPPVNSVAGCTVVSTVSEPDPMIEELFPPVSANDWVKGPETARVTIIEYSDFQ
jgi:hypothetical protein